MPKVRLDVLLVEKGLADSRAKAQALIMAGQVRIADQVALKPAVTVQPDAVLTVDTGPRYVSRGGEKIEGALTRFAIDVTGFTCADVGASTGGFSDCLLQHGAVKIYAIDVGKGILHWKLRNDPRVVVMEETNARFVESLPEQIDFVTVDASFISLKTLLPVIKKWNAAHGIVALIKPQFEAGKKLVSRGDGVIRDPEVHRQVLVDVLTFAKAEGFGVRGLVRSTLLGPKGNTEFLVWLEMHPNDGEVEELVNGVIPPLEQE
ncbi:MAG: TlyA family RNA methyltransferase [Anaerolineales bacterium]|jgi:23S rRNA (cytidine1920-2'-O)/16S rRNA (cytidine1409-2'-O)-methyltransferase|uniref:TlyA family RNA methyltransferase n=1 Tax=Candidatus Villigracilis vicinus TaxID=3140679 RepID=UPI0031367398|nr:TlyA family RNA methyltransferase [Anaerolineales bacterium]MBK7452136.1 TlyA family RNA methyltransferase [Anaerolineales bacterium]MBK9780061.1 TlyA family RNA methyltransferase [Anaerolineales bacterium]